MYCDGTANRTSVFKLSIGYIFGDVFSIRETLMTAPTNDMALLNKQIQNSRSGQCSSEMQCS